MTQHPVLPEHLDHDRSASTGSERGFGFVFATAFALVGAWPTWSGGAPRWWALALGAAFLLAAVLAPRILGPLNTGWLAFGRLLHRLVSPLVLGMLFYLTVVPTGVAMRLLRKDPLRLRFDRDARSYWLERKPPGPPPESLRNQF